MMQFIQKQISSRLTHVFVCDIPHVANVHDASMMPHDTDSDRVLAYLRGDVALHLNTQLLQHQQPYIHTHTHNEQTVRALLLQNSRDALALSQSIFAQNSSFIVHYSILFCSCCAIWQMKILFLESKCRSDSHLCNVM